MKELTCEMCGSTEIIKQDGMYICQTCGTKYSVEEAKKMMIEGTVDVSGSTVKVDNTAPIENYFKMAESAYESSNQKEAENYCNKIIEIDPNNYKAWLLKGKAAGWQSTLGNIRVEESVNCFTKALDNAPEEEKSAIKKEASAEIENLSTALMKLCCNNFANFASHDNVNSILNNLV
jgi:tetratricopeptide (TPR) repeat protein